MPFSSFSSSKISFYDFSARRIDALSSHYLLSKLKIVAKRRTVIYVLAAAAVTAAGNAKDGKSLFNMAFLSAKD